jgi:16S rRNA (guanine527-N7)-methyltransferase
VYGAVTEHPPVAKLEVLTERGIRLDRDQLDRFERYSGILRKWNARLNLTAIVDPAEIATKHFLDSLTLLVAQPPPPRARLVDVGTGAGFPGVPLALARPDIRVTVIESVAKKVRFLEALVPALDLANVDVAHARAEALGHDAAHRERYDVAIARALPLLATNLELLLPFCRVGGEAVAFKGRIEAELPAAARAAREVGGEIVRVVTTAELSLGDVLPGRCLVFAAKRRGTSDRYPRPAAELRRRPW